MQEGLVIRPAISADRDDLIEINIRAWHSTYRGLIADDYLDSMTHDSLLNKWEHTLTAHPEQVVCLVAIFDTAVIGYVVCGKNNDETSRFDWRLYAIYLLSEHQGKGVGKRLFFAAVEEMKRRNVSSFDLFVLKENDLARGFYESFGPDSQVERSLRLGENEYEDIGYGWSDLTKIE